MTDTLTNQSQNRQDRSQNMTVLAWVRLMRVYHKMDRRSADEMKRWNLSVSRFDVLNHAGANEGRTQQELADALFVTKGNVCQLLDGMEADGLLYRRRKGRTNHIFLTDAGRALRASSLSGHEARIADDMAALTPDEQQTLLRLLRKLERSLDARDQTEN